MNNGVETCSLIQFCLFDMLGIRSGTFSECSGCKAEKQGLCRVLLGPLGPSICFLSGKEHAATFISPRKTGEQMVERGLTGDHFSSRISTLALHT